MKRFAEGDHQKDCLSTGLIQSFGGEATLSYSANDHQGVTDRRVRPKRGGSTTGAAPPSVAWIAPLPQTNARPCRQGPWPSFRARPVAKSERHLREADRRVLSDQLSADIYQYSMHNPKEEACPSTS
jgi:hypothetical protein